MTANSQPICLVTVQQAVCQADDSQPLTPDPPMHLNGGMSAGRSARPLALSPDCARVRRPASDARSGRRGGVSRQPTWLAQLAQRSSPTSRVRACRLHGKQRFWARYCTGDVAGERRARRSLAVGSRLHWTALTGPRLGRDDQGPPRSAVRGGSRERARREEAAARQHGPAPSASAARTTD